MFGRTAPPSSTDINQASYPLTFSPVRATEQDFVSKLVLADLKDKGKPVKFDFDLRGTAEEPLAEGHRVVRCSARERVEQVFQLKNVTGKGEEWNCSRLYCPSEIMGSKPTSER